MYKSYKRSKCSLGLEITETGLSGTGQVVSQIGVALVTAKKCYILVH